MHLQKCLTFGVHIRTGGISFSGIALTATGDAQVRFRLACQSCKYYLLLVNGYPHLSFRAALILFEVANWKRGISVSEPLSFQTLASETYENYPCEKLKLAKGSKKEIPHLLFSSSPLTCAVRDDNMLRTCLFFIIAFYSLVNLYRTTKT